MGKRAGNLFVRTGLALLAAAGPALAQSHSECHLAATGQLNRGTNPTDAQIRAEMIDLAQEFNIPSEVIAAIGWQEGGIRHFASDGYLLHNMSECTGLYRGATSPDPPGLGMMQLTGGTARAYDVARLRTEWQYNLRSGVTVLSGKFAAYKASCPSWLATLNQQNRHVIENWYMAAWRYNGYVGNYGYYADKIFAHIQNRPGRLAGFIPAGLNPTEPDVAIPHFFGSAYGEAYVALPDGTWRCVHDQTFSAPVTLTTTGPLPSPGPAPDPGPPYEEKSDHDQGFDRYCSGSAPATGALPWLALLLAAALGVRRPL